MDQKTCLVIVDMQHYFKAARNQSVIRACKREISEAITNNIPIIFLQYSSSLYNGTLPQLRKMVVRYPYKQYVDKILNDGSDKIAGTLNDWHIRPAQIRVCGVNRCACIKATVSGLLDRYTRSQVILIDDAIGDEWYGNYDLAGSSFNGYGDRIQVVNKQF